MSDQIKVPAGPVRANVQNPDVTERPTHPNTTAVVPPGSNFGHTHDGHVVPVFDQFGNPLPGVTIHPR